MRTMHYLDDAHDAADRGDWCQVADIMGKYYRTIGPVMGRQTQATTVRHEPTPQARAAARHEVSARLAEAVKDRVDAGSHEASHVIGVLLMGGTVFSAEADRLGSGHVRYSLAASRQRLAGAVVGWIGACGEVMGGRPLTPATFYHKQCQAIRDTLSNSDRAHIVRALECAEVHAEYDGQALDDTLASTEAMVRAVALQHQYWPAICDVRRALVMRQRLTGNEIRALVPNLRPLD